MAIMKANSVVMACLDIEFPDPKTIVLRNYIMPKNNDDAISFKEISWRYTHPDSKNYLCETNYGVEFEDFKKEIERLLANIYKKATVNISVTKTNPTTMEFVSWHCKGVHQTTLYGSYVKFREFNRGSSTYRGTIKQAGDTHTLTIPSNESGHTLFMFSPSRILVHTNPLYGINVVNFGGDDKPMNIRMDKIAVGFFFKKWVLPNYADIEVRFEITDKFLVLEADNVDDDKSSTYSYKYQAYYPLRLVTVVPEGENKL